MASWEDVGRERPLRRADHEALGADAPADDPGVYFTTPHFDGYPMVLVRLAEISESDLTELVTDAWLAQAPKSLVKRYLAG